ncbi:MAG: hypothetical protein EAZ61_07195 [Oscillatoriales cyanobacterium]|nr:MAG: hypothetical protein EAZ61_07195 [Oscillatoriales cyanobacterium]
MTWFERLTGFREVSPDRVREQIVVEGDRLTSIVNQKSYVYGRLETPSLAELRRRVDRDRADASGKLAVREVIADVQQLHADPANAGAVFQVASQFNLLEMVNPAVTPEEGVGIYEQDATQGPQCAIAAGAGTIYRNYFVDVMGEIGQSASHQLDCLADLGAALGNADGQLWTMRNGYALASREGLRQISQRLQASSSTEIDRLRQALRIGVQHQTQVTIGEAQHRVTQAYCSALPVAYSSCEAELWEAFARLVLEASYEATIGTAILNRLATGNPAVFLTLLGGGVFGNSLDWIVDAMLRALVRYRDWDLDVAIVSYGGSKAAVRSVVERYTRS